MIFIERDKKKDICKKYLFKIVQKIYVNMMKMKINQYNVKCTPSWTCLETTRILWNGLETTWILWNGLETTWILWNSLETTWILWNGLETTWILWNGLETTWILWNGLMECSG